MNPLEKSINLIGIMKVSKAAGVTNGAVMNWQRRGKLPRTEWTGETNYAEKISEATGGEVTVDDFLSVYPENIVINSDKGSK